jgi:hypothetical protein
MEYTDVWKKPFHTRADFYVISSSGVMALNVSSPIGVTKICNLLNGEKETFDSIEKLNSTEYAVDNYKVTLRGWGHLIGIGGLALDPKEAARIQDDFGDMLYNLVKESCK